MSINMYKRLLLVFLLAMPVIVNAQSGGSRADIVNKTWRIMAIKCPEQYSDANHEDQYIQYYSSLRMTPTGGYAGENYGTYVRVHRDKRDNPRETGTYQFNTGQDGATWVTLKPKRGNAMQYRIEFANANYMTLVNMAENEKCKFSYAVAP